MDHHEITNKRVWRIAEEHGCTIDEAHAVLDHHPIELDRDKYLKRALALELIRLDQLETAFEAKALVDRDVAAGTLLVKIAERRATLLGMNAPIGHAVAVVQHEPVRPTSTERLRRVLDELLGEGRAKDDPPAAH